MIPEGWTLIALKRSRPIKIAGIQISSSEDIDRNVQKALRYIGHAAESGARVLCFPQLFTLPWFLKEQDPETLNLAVDLEDPLLGLFREAAREHGTVLVCPFFEKRGAGTFSSAAVIDADGSIAGVYQKVHIPDIPDWREKFYFQPGEQGFGVFETARGRIGVQLCWDNFFPEGCRALALKGAEIIFAPTAAAYASQERWFHVISANAFMNNVFVFRVNRVGHDHGLDFYGHSFCVDPYGELAADPIGMKESIVLAEVDLSRVAKIREQSGFIRDRRTEVYGDLVRNDFREMP